MVVTTFAVQGREKLRTSKGFQYVFDAGEVIGKILGDVVEGFEVDAHPYFALLGDHHQV